MNKKINTSRYSKCICVVLMAVLIITLPFMQTASRAGGVVSDFLGLNGFTGNVVDGTFDAGLKIAGGPVYNLAKSFYDTGTDIVGLYTKDYTSTQRAAAWTKIGSNIVGMGAIITIIATGSATLPVIAGITVAVAFIGTIADAVKNGDKILGWLKDHIGDPLKNLLNVYKPNIYIYSDKDINVNVKLYPYEYITKSIPQYDSKKGWNAIVFDGSINGSNDFLFYEAKVPDLYFQRSEGFVVSDETLGSDLLNILSLYGFNEKESDDFIKYWENKLNKDTDYIFYPQETDTVNKIMPVEISPEPETIFRLWFLIEPVENNNPSICEPAQIEKIKRQNYTLVEWGGVI